MASAVGDGGDVGGAARAEEGRPPPGWPSSLNSAESHAVPDVEVLKDGISARYVGKGNHANDHGSVRSKEPVPRGQSVYYFEAELVDGGFRGLVTVGLSRPSFTLTRQVGTRPLSFGYRGENGRKFCGEAGRGELYGPFFNTSDVVGCGVNFLTGEVFFTKNGRYLGPAFDALPSDVELYPTVSMHSPGEMVRFNFGRRPFRFDVAAMRAEARARVEEEVAATAVDPRACVALVRSYLAHRGLYETLRAFEAPYGNDDSGEGGAGTGAGAQASYDDILRRKAVCQLVARGEIEGAIAALERDYPGLLARDRALLFELHCQHFVETVRAGRVDDALAYVRGKLASYRDDPGVPHGQLAETIGMLAYVDVARSPAAYLLAQDRRDRVADIANAAVLRHLGQPTSPALETLVRQLRLAHAHLRCGEDLA